MSTAAWRIVGKMISIIGWSLHMCIEPFKKELAWAVDKQLQVISTSYI